MDFTTYLTIDTKTRFGKPIIKGTRISVYDVIQWFASGMSMEEILDDFPELTKESVLACLAYVSNRENRLIVA